MGCTHCDCPKPKLYSIPNGPVIDLLAIVMDFRLPEQRIAVLAYSIQAMENGRIVSASALQIEERTALVETVMWQRADQRN